jgi:hypothetical protein
VLQASLSPTAIHLTTALDVESRVSTLPLGLLATLSCGTAGYAAAKIARCLRDDYRGMGASADEADFITSGSIDRYSIRVGDVRYLNRDYVRPRLNLDCAELTPTKRRLVRSQKIVIAGMSKRLEAAWDDRGLALGVQVFAVSESQLESWYLLALLNSTLLSYLFATRYAAKRLSGGYLAINKGQLVQLPILNATGMDRTDRRRVRCLARLARDWRPSHDDQIDRLVYQLYRLTDDEIERVESHFAPPTSRAA